MKNDGFIASLRASIKEARAGEQEINSALSILKAVDASVVTFLSDNHFTSHSATEVGFESLLDEDGMDFSSEKISIEDASFNMNSVVDLVDAAKVPSYQTEHACTEVCNLIQAFSNKSRRGTPADVLAKRPSTTTLALEDALPGVLAMQVNNIAMETFGKDYDVIASDLRKSLTMSLLKFSTSVVLRGIYSRATQEPVVLWKKNIVEGFKLDDPTTIISYTDMVSNPNTLGNELQQFELLVANDGSNTYLVEDDVVKFDVDANLWDLSVDATRVGWDKYDHTDLISDGATLKSIIVAVTNAGDTKTETFEFKVFGDAGRFVFATNVTDSLDRVLVPREFQLVLNSATLDINGAANTLFTDATGNDSVVATLKPMGSMNLRSGICSVHANKVVSTKNSAGGSVASAVTDLVEGAGAHTYELVGYTLDVRRSEQNLRSSVKVIRKRTADQAVLMPQPTHFLADFERNDAMDPSVISEITSIAMLGVDGSALSMIDATLNFLASELTAVTAGAKDNADVASHFIAGPKVKAALFTGTLDLSNVESIKGSDLQSDIRAFALNYMMNVCTKMCADSLYDAQMAGRTRVFRLFTSSPIAGALIGPNPIYSGMEKTAMGDASGVDYSVLLPGNIRLEVVIAPYEQLKGNIYMLPYVEDGSDMNSFMHMVYGTAVGTGPITDGNAQFTRLDVATRQLTHPSCPVMAKLNVSGLEAAVGLS